MILATAPRKWCAKRDGPAVSDAWRLRPHLRSGVGWAAKVSSGVRLACSVVGGLGSPNGGDNFVGHFDGILVFPEAQRVPSCGEESTVRVLVSLRVRGQLLPPVVGVVSGRGAVMVGAPVPEAAVDEDGDPQRGKGNVRSSPTIERQWIVHPVSKPGGVEESAYVKFWAGVSSRVRAHDRSSRWASGPGSLRCLWHSYTLRTGHRSPLDEGLAVARDLNDSRWSASGRALGFADDRDRGCRLWCPVTP